MCLYQAPLAVVAKGGGGEERLPVAVAFAHQGEEQVAAGAQEDERGPAGHLQLVPEARLAVIHHRVADVVAEHGAADVPQDLLRNKGPAFKWNVCFPASEQRSS